MREEGRKGGIGRERGIEREEVEVGKGDMGREQPENSRLQCRHRLQRTGDRRGAARKAVVAVGAQRTDTDEYQTGFTALNLLPPPPAPPRGRGDSDSGDSESRGDSAPRRVLGALSALLCAASQRPRRVQTDRDGGNGPRRKARGVRIETDRVIQRRVDRGGRGVRMVPQANRRRIDYTVQ